MSEFQELVNLELQKARGDYPNLQSLHEAFAVMLEELDEFKAEVWKRPRLRNRTDLLHELVQLGAMVQRTAEDLLL